MTESQFWIQMRDYPGGILQFERDFNNEFIPAIERNRTAQADERFFTDVAPTQSVYELFARENYTIADVDAIGYLPKSERIDELFAYGLAPEDFDQWYALLLTARHEGTMPSVQSHELFSDVMKRIFLQKKSAV